MYVFCIIMKKKLWTGTLCIISVDGAVIISAPVKTQAAKFRIWGLKGPWLLQFLWFFIPPHTVRCHGNHSLTPPPRLSFPLVFTLKTHQWPTLLLLEGLLVWVCYFSLTSAGDATHCTTLVPTSSVGRTICPWACYTGSALLSLPSGS